MQQYYDSSNRIKRGINHLRWRWRCQASVRGADDSWRRPPPTSQPARSLGSWICTLSPTMKKKMAAESWFCPLFHILRRRQQRGHGSDCPNLGHHWAGMRGGAADSGRGWIGWGACGRRRWAGCKAAAKMNGWGYDGGADAPHGGVDVLGCGAGGVGKGQLWDWVCFRVWYLSVY